MRLQSYDIVESRCLTVTDLAKLFLKKLQKCGFLPTGGYHNTHTARCYLALGDSPRPHFSYFLWRKERSKETSTPSKASPYMGRMQLILGPARNQSFGMTHRAFALRVSHGDDDYAGRWSLFSSGAGESCFILCFCGIMILMRYVVVGCCGLGGRVVRLPRIGG